MHTPTHTHSQAASMPLKLIAFGSSTLICFPAKHSKAAALRLFVAEACFDSGREKNNCSKMLNDSRLLGGVRAVRVIWENYRFSKGDPTAHLTPRPTYSAQINTHILYESIITQAFHVTVMSQPCMRGFLKTTCMTCSLILFNGNKNQ